MGILAKKCLNTVDQWWLRLVSNFYHEIIIIQMPAQVWRLLSITTFLSFFPFLLFPFLSTFLFLLICGVLDNKWNKPGYASSDGAFIQRLIVIRIRWSKSLSWKNFINIITTEGNQDYESLFSAISRRLFNAFSRRLSIRLQFPLLQSDRF